MLGSQIIEIDGIYVGTAILVDRNQTHRFYATHDNVRSLHNMIVPDMTALKHRVAQTFRRMARCDVGALGRLRPQGQA
ncbi:hypothetical protein [Novacetimonas hansenii]|uniref:Uncharacterized protein n=1 Tax=Novacetimonas hansenii TaxID=436 RepID=A0ABQ0SAZ7_NOVHA|nr:hypothetical protein [Novacetimonas hansenii]GEC62420.1 hypothetical protein GHA01_02690 [Novacetimonas hansenii]